MCKPLAGKKIIVTRDERQAVGLVEKINALGGEAVVFPTIKIVGPANLKPCRQVIKEIELYDWIVFSSVNSVKFFMQIAQKNGPGSISSSIAAIGDRTFLQLEHYGYQVDIKPSEFSASGLLSAFASYPVNGKRFLIPCSNLARDELTCELQLRGAIVNSVCFYRSVPNTCSDSEMIKKQIFAHEIDFLTFFSPSAFRFFLRIMGEDFADRIKSSAVKIAAIGPTTAKEIKRKGLNVTVVPEKCDENSLIQSIIQYMTANIQTNGESAI